eukprot:gene25471-11131_t
MDTPSPTVFSPGGLYSIYNKLPVLMPMTCRLQMTEKIDMGSVTVGSIVNVVKLVVGYLQGQK